MLIVDYQHAHADDEANSVLFLDGSNGPAWSSEAALQADAKGGSAAMARSDLRQWCAIAKGSKMGCSIEALCPREKSMAQTGRLLHCCAIEIGSMARPVLGLFRGSFFMADAEALAGFSLDWVVVFLVEQH